MPRRRIRKSRLALIFDRAQPIYDCIIVDVNTQRDFLSTEGVLPIQDRQHVIERIRKVMEWAKLYRLPIISLVDVHRPNGQFIRSSLFPCIEGTLGQQKMPFTLIPKRFILEHDASPSLPENLFENYLQIVIHKRTNDVFTNPKADRLFSHLQTKRFLILGVGTERAIKALALGLLSRGQHPIVVSDSCGCWDSDAASLALRQIEAKGAIVVKTEDIIHTDPENLPVPQIEISSEIE
ncbi:MAG: isochorismatase family protein [Phycisphaerae bacterium]